MTNAAIIMTGLIISWLFADSGAVRAESFRRIAGAQIEARFSAKDMTDDVHWRDSFGREGPLISHRWAAGDGLGMAETTPGPLIMVLQFVGFMGAFRDPGSLHPMLAGTLGGILTTWVTFVPCFLWIFLGAPYVEALRENKAWSAALVTITAAVVGVVLNLAVWFALHVLFRELNEVHTLGMTIEVPVLASINVASLVLMLGALIAVFRFKINMIAVLGTCAAIGVVYYLAIGQVA